MTVELNTERIYTELTWLRQEVQGLRSKLDALAPASRPSLHTEQQGLFLCRQHARCSSMRAARILRRSE